MHPHPEGKNCDNCGRCEYIGKGDYACIASDPVIVKENFQLGRNYFCCGGSRWEAQ